MSDLLVKLLPSLVGVPLGLLSYYFIKLWMEPYFEYEKLRAKINADLFYFANAIEIDMTDKESLLYKKYIERCDTFRRYAADLLALYPLLPAWHRTQNWEVDEHPEKAIGPLLKYANAPFADWVREAEQEISALLKLPKIPS
jgi:hypothetical protein